MEYITIKDKEYVNLGMIDDEIRKVCKDGGAHELLVQVQGNAEEIYQLQKDLWHGRGVANTQVENLDQNLLMLTFRTKVFQQ